MRKPCPHCGAKHEAHEERCPTTGRPIGGDPTLVGTTLAGRYQLVRLLGDGGMGAVYKAADQVLRRFVAIKLLHPTVAQKPAAVDRFQREARAAANIGHPNIIDIMDFGVDHRPYMVMEYLRGRSLSQVLATERVLDIARAATIATHTLAGLAAAHERGILHRDLKPANLMVLQRFGDRNFVKVCDFGFAALMGESTVDDAKTLTPERTLVGTPVYAAPERLRGDDRRDPRTDIYSVGVVLFEMIAGRRPFDAPSFRELAKMVRNEPPPSLLQFRSDVPRELDRVIQRALSKNIEDRFRDAGAFAAALVPFGGRDVVRDDEPSDSFALEVWQIKVRETQRRGNTKHSIELPAPRSTAIRTEVGRAPEPQRAEAPRSELQRPDPPRAEPPRAEPQREPQRAEPQRSAHQRLEPPRTANQRSVYEPPEGLRTAIQAPPFATLKNVLPPAAARRHDDPREAEFDPGDRTEAGTAPPGFRDHPSDYPPHDGESEHQDTMVALRVRGGIVLSVLRFIARKYGERSVKQVLDTMPPSARNPFVDGIEGEKWIDGLALRSLVEHVDTQLGADDLHTIVECGRAAAEGAFDEMRRLKPPSPPVDLLLSEMSTLSLQFFVGLEIVLRKLGPGFARLEIIEHDMPSLTTAVLSLGFLERSLGRFGADDVEVNMVSSRALGDHQTILEASWLLPRAS